MTTDFVPENFEVPRVLQADGFRLEPLNASHNAGDHAAWTGSVDHIRATPGFGTGSWPPETMSLQDNLADLERHYREFETRTRFAYSVLEATSGTVIGCVYISRPKKPGHDVSIKSWVSEDRAHLDGPLVETVTRWLGSTWPFATIDYR